MMSKQTILDLLTHPSAETYGEMLRAVIAEERFNVHAQDLDALWQQFEVGDISGVRNRIVAIMELWVHNPEIHVLASAIARRMGNQQDAEMEAHFARCCYLGMLATGDGSFERPYQVARVVDEYALLRHLKRSCVSQEARTRDGYVVDVFTCTDGTTIHFQLPRVDLLTGRASTPSAAYKRFVSPTGMSGFALVSSGERAGELQDFFASPFERPGTVDGLMSLAVQNGANKLVTYEHPLLAKFFEQFGFQTTSIFAPGDFEAVPQGWMPESASERDRRSWPSFLYMALFSPIQVVGLRARAPARPGERVDYRQGPCVRCQHVISTSSCFGAFTGYDCTSCGFIYVCGTLTMGPPGPERPKPIARP